MTCKIGLSSTRADCVNFEKGVSQLVSQIDRVHVERSFTGLVNRQFSVITAVRSVGR